MASQPPNTWVIDRAPNGRTRILVHGYSPQTGGRMGMGDEFDKEQIRRMVRDLCRAAGLPEPWKEG